MTCLSSWYHVYIAGVAVAVYVLARGWPWRQRLFTRRTLIGGVTFAVIAGAMILPLALPLLQYGSKEKGIDWPMVSADDASASVDDLLLPSAYHPLWGDLALQRRAETSANIVPGAVYLSIAGAAARSLCPAQAARAAAWPIFLVGLVGAVLTLGLTLHVNGVRVLHPGSGVRGRHVLARHADTGRQAGAQSRRVYAVPRRRRNSHPAARHGILAVHALRQHDARLPPLRHG